MSLARRRQPILALVSVCGTTEESAVDRLDQVLEVRARAEAELGATFHLHSDACYGGYAAAVTRRADGTYRRRCRTCAIDTQKNYRNKRSAK